MGLASLASKAGLGTKWRVEAVKLAALAVPVTVTYTLNFGVTLASVIFLGHLGAKELAAGILGTHVPVAGCYLLSSKGHCCAT